MSVRVATTVNITLSSATITVDGVTLADNDLILVKNQNTGTQNGIYVVSTSGSWVRSTLMSAGNDANGVCVFVRSGTFGAGNTYICTSNPGTVGLNSLVFSLSLGTNPYRLYWSSPANGNPTAGQLINASLTGNAVYTNVLDGVTLTTATTSQAGQVNWNVAGFDFTRDFQLSVCMFQGSGADGISFGVGGSSTFTNGASTVNGGLCFQYNTFSSNLNDTFYINGSTTGNTVAFHSGVTYTNTWMTTRMVVQTYGTARYATIYTGNNSSADNSVVVTSWVPGGTFIFVGGRTGLSSAQHFCNHVNLKYI